MCSDKMHGGAKKALKVSVITVCKNAESTIIDTLHSVLSQSYKNYEHIIVDGKSNDRTLEIINSITPNKLKLISEADSGIYDAMNKGILNSTGDIIAFLSADDRYAHNYVFEKIVNEFNRREIDAVLGDVGFFRSTNRDKIVRRYNSRRFTVKRIPWGWMPAHPALFMRRDIYERIGLFKTNYKIAGDFEYIVRVFWNNIIRFDYLSEVLVQMQLGGVSTKGGRNTILLNKEVLRACRENGVNSNYFMILSKYPLKILEYFRYRN